MMITRCYDGKIYTILKKSTQHSRTFNIKQKSKEMLLLQKKLLCLFKDKSIL